MLSLNHDTPHHGQPPGPVFGNVSRVTSHSSSWWSLAWLLVGGPWGPAEGREDEPDEQAEDNESGDVEADQVEDKASTRSVHDVDSRQAWLNGTRQAGWKRVANHLRVGRRLAPRPAFRNDNDGTCLRRFLDARLTTGADVGA
jgi:hypothetical protein